jgi:hypothetical protein
VNEIKQKLYYIEYENKSHIYQLMWINDLLKKQIEKFEDRGMIT